LLFLTEDSRLIISAATYLDHVFSSRPLHGAGCDASLVVIRPLLNTYCWHHLTTTAALVITTTRACV